MPSERDILEHLRLCVSQPKEFDDTVDWKTINNSNRPRLEAVVGLRADGVSLDGLRLRANASLEFCDRDVTIQLELIRWGTKFHLTRADFRPFAAHQNTRRRELSHLPRRIEAGVTHVHHFGDNARLGVNAFRSTKIDNLPAAAPMEPVPGSVREFLEVVAQCVNIDNCTEMPLPPWQGRLIG
jgi:hypothetical protein